MKTMNIENALDQIAEGKYPSKNLEIFFQALKNWVIENWDSDLEYVRSIKDIFYTMVALRYPDRSLFKGFCILSQWKWSKNTMKKLDVHSQITKFIKSLSLDLDKSKIYEKTKQYIKSNFCSLSAKEYENLINHVTKEIQI